MRSKIAAMGFQENGILDVAFNLLERVTRDWACWMPAPVIRGRMSAAVAVIVEIGRERERIWVREILIDCQRRLKGGGMLDIRCSNGETDGYDLVVVSSRIYSIS